MKTLRGANAVAQVFGASAWFLCGLAQVLLLEPKRALEQGGDGYCFCRGFRTTAPVLDDSMQIIGRTGQRWLEAELNRHKGELLLRQGNSEAAEELYRKALSIAQEQEAKMWVLRAAVSLARLCHDQGRRVEAHDLLAPVYCWFTEGFTIPDLIEAKALLDELT